ncbi:MAG TPA: CRTAC1 family protein [Bacteroidetes bacterium]|nr:CRTAC1 family protein [Bacteroidota bacterium]
MKKILFVLLALVLLAVAAVLLFFSTDTKNPYEKVTWGKFAGECKADEMPNKNYGKDHPGCDYDVPKETIPVFNEINFPFTNIFDNKKSLPLMAAAMIDVDGDGVDEVFVGGGVTQQNAVFKYTENGFVDISENIKLPKKPAGTTTFGAVSFDMDKDGNTDLILSGDHGLYFYKNTGSTFEAHKIAVQLNEKSTAATATIGDYNKDGHADIFLCNYIPLNKMEGQTIFKDFNYGASSLLLKNNGDNTFKDVTKEAGLEYVHNTFQAVFVDIDNDGFLDLTVAYDTGEARTYKNMDGNKFKLMPNPLTGKYGYPMGIAVGDYNNDGRIDFFFSNTGSSVPKFMAKGDLAEGDEIVLDWILFRNDGNFKFTDAAKETNIADFEFSWGAIFEDFNLDGLQDLVVAENYVDFPPHKLFKLPGRFLLQRPGGKFAAVEDQAGVINKNYAITPLTSDFNQDGYPDLVFSNLDGKIKAFINRGGANHYLSVRFPETAEYAGTTVQVQTADGKTLSDVYVIGKGLSSDQTCTLTFGLGTAETAKSIKIKYPSGKEKVIENPAVDKVHLIE